MRAAVEWHAEDAGIGDAAAADTVGRLEQREARVRRGDPPRRGNAGGAGADDRHIDVAGPATLRRRPARRPAAAAAARKVRRVSAIMVSKILPEAAHIA